MNCKKGRAGFCEYAVKLKLPVMLFWSFKNTIRCWSLVLDIALLGKNLVVTVFWLIV